MQQLILMMAVGAVGAGATYFLQEQGLSAVVASCLVGLIGAGIGGMASQTHISAMFFAGSFVGMTASHVVPLPIVALAGAVAGIIYTFSQPLFPGFGGRLGTIAFISCLIAIGILHLVKRLMS